MKVWIIMTLVLLCEEFQNGLSQQGNPRKEGGRRQKNRSGKRKESESAGKGQSILTQVLDKGRFLRLVDSLTLSSGKDLELRCKGSRIGWAYPTYLDTFKDSRLSIRQQDKYSQLILTSPVAADTGEFSCWALLCDGDECTRDTDRTSSAYIYFTDKDELFVPSTTHFDIIYLRPDKPSVIPCRVTSPLAKVTLHREVPPGEVSVDGTQISYNPRKGFIIQQPSLEDTGIFYCKAVSRSTPQMSVKYQLLYVEVPSGPPSVTIEASSTTVGGGDNINVTCTVLGDPDVDVDFVWTFPGQDQRPVSITEAWRLINRGSGHTTRISQSVIAVEDIETIDFGDYICTAKNIHGETSVAAQVASY